LRIVLGNQLFPIDKLPSADGIVVFMAEDFSLCTDVAHHKQKVILFLAAMRHYADGLRESGYEVCYHRLNPADTRSYEEKLTAAIAEFDCDGASHFEVEDEPMARRLAAWAKSGKIEVAIDTSPMFLCSRQQFSEYLAGVPRPRMADFYQAERKRLGLLIEPDGAPSGGRWSFDADNRKRLPREIIPPPLPEPSEQPHVTEVTRLVEQLLPNHPGESGPVWLPTTRDAALAWLDEFLHSRLSLFGPYEDAITGRSRALYHSVLSPSLNLGLVTPREVVDRVLGVAREKDIPLNSLEGFIRQLVGWREFVRGIYHEFGALQKQSNFWRHERKPAGSWYDADTGIAPLDDAIRNAWNFGWDHHIARLMIVGNMMTLAEIAPPHAYRWFMEMYVDSADWVMTPNVFGMALFSDGGLFATKPYICGSNYLLKMSDFRRDSWCDVLDGLYWRFVSRHREFFAANPRLSMMPRAFDRLDASRRQRILAEAETFLDEHTIAA
jgi:deoxyribodipyrimidine photolyase-related protein